MASDYQEFRDHEVPPARPLNFANIGIHHLHTHLDSISIKKFILIDVLFRFVQGGATVNYSGCVPNKVANSAVMGGTYTKVNKEVSIVYT